MRFCYLDLIFSLFYLYNIHPFSAGDVVCCFPADYRCFRFDHCRCRIVDDFLTWRNTELKILEGYRDQRATYQFVQAEVSGLLLEVNCVPKLVKTPNFILRESYCQSRNNCSCDYIYVSNCLKVLREVEIWEKDRGWEKKKKIMASWGITVEVEVIKAQNLKAIFFFQKHSHIWLWDLFFSSFQLHLYFIFGIFSGI